MFLNIALFIMVCCDSCCKNIVLNLNLCSYNSHDNNLQIIILINLQLHVYKGNLRMFKKYCRKMGGYVFYT